MGAFFTYTIYWFLVGSLTMFLNRALPDKFISRYTHLVFRRKVNPRFYEKRLRIKAWKDRLPEMSSFDNSVFDKSSLKSMNKEYLKRYETELDKGLFAHSFPILFLLPIANEAGSDMAVWFNAILISMVHMPFLAILRYNQARMGKLLQFINRKEERKNRKVNLKE